MAVDIPAVREIVGRAFTRKEVLEACERRDLGAVITALCAQGVTQGQLSPYRDTAGTAERVQGA